MTSSLTRLSLLTVVALAPHAWCQAQSQGHLGVEVTVLPAALRITVTSGRVDFGLQRADAGVVVLDPATGEISGTAGGLHALGAVQVTGRAGTPFAVRVDAPGTLQGDHLDISFGLRWAQAGGCSGAAYNAITHRRSFSGRLSEAGEACLRFGGALALDGVPPGQYVGAVQVRLAAL